MVVTGVVAGEPGKESYRELFEELTEAFALHNLCLDEQGQADCRLLEANPAFERLIGCRKEQAVGRSLLELLPGIEPSVLATCARVADTGAAAHFEYARPGCAQQFHVAAFSRWPGRVATLFVDLGEKTNADDSLRESERHYRLLFETMLQGVIYQDADGRVISMNPGAERILGKSPAEYLGQTSVSLEHHCIRLDGSPFPGLEHPSMVALRTGKAVRDVVMGVFNPREQRYRWITISAVPLFREGEARPHQVHTIFHDLTERMQAEAELRRAKEEWEQTFNTVPDMLSILDDQYRIVRVNRAMADRIGRQPEECVGNYCYEVVHGLSSPPPFCPHALTRVDRQPHVAEVWEPRFGRDLQVTTSPRFDSDGQLIGAVHVARDITEAKRAEQALRVGEERFRLTALATTDGIWDWDLITDTIWWNDAHHRAFGSRLAGTTSPWQWWNDQLHPDDRERVLSSVQRALRGSATQWTSEYRLRRLDGTWAPVLDRAHIARDANGRPSRILGALLDLTERKKAEQALRDNEERWREAVESAEVGAWDIDLLHDTTWRSPRHHEILGTPPGPPPEWTSQILLEHVLPEDRPAFEANMQEAIAKHIPWSFECRIRRDDGAVRWVWMHGGQRYDERGEPIRMFGLVQDISERKQMEQDRERHLAAIEEANQAKDLFFNTLSHELRTPLAAMLNSVEVLKNSEASEVHRERAFTVLERNIRHQTRLIEDLLDLSRIMRGKVELQRELLDLREVVSAQLETTESEARKARLKLEAGLPDHVVRIVGDAVRLGQVISNLLTNAVKFTEPGGSIGVKVCIEDHQAVVRVQDSGIGLSREMLPHIFEPFRQAESSLRRGKGGLGVGLAVARSLAELQGGGLQAASAGLGEGSEFTLRLPLFDQQAAPKQADAADVPVCGKRQRVLVVEDNPDLRETLSILLGLMGHIAIQAADGATALELAIRERPDTALVDIGLPDIDGYQLARSLRAAVPGDMRLYALSGYATPEHRERARAAGFDHHLAKPVEAAELQQLLDGGLPAVKKKSSCLKIS